MTKKIVTSGCFDNLSSKHIRFLFELSKYGNVDVLLFSDDLIKSLTGSISKLPLLERKYYLESVRYVEKVHVIESVTQLQHISEIIGNLAHKWYVHSSEEIKVCKEYSQSQNIPLNCIKDEQIKGFSDNEESSMIPSSFQKKVIVSGSFDWFHSGHVRFLEEASEYGELYVVVGNDKNIELLKGLGHPKFPEAERKFIVNSIRFVKKTFISTGSGWLDVEPEIQQLKPDIYIVNEDGDKDIKHEYCKKHGIEYIVLKRLPREGLTRRTSTALRGF
ncbi:MAG: hypothetical protein A2Y12_18815 [Planctomycetes bacterium GWF2_42_9]|nr:MAG: hypothetical protein A2Y12_18815 [Planctomycetes bacterium GWF2_42_9]